MENESLLSDLPASTFKVWTTGLNNWHFHAKHPATGAWIAQHGLYSEVAALFSGNRACDQLDAEASQ
jgi:hypothetical protein